MRRGKSGEEKETGGGKRETEGGKRRNIPQPPWWPLPFGH